MGYDKIEEEKQLARLRQYSVAQIEKEEFGNERMEDGETKRGRRRSRCHSSAFEFVGRGATGGSFGDDLALQYLSLIHI